MENNQIEETILEKLKQNYIWFQLKFKRYDGSDNNGEHYHNVYVVGRDEEHIFGEIDFCKNPVWRLSWYNDGKVYRDTGFVLINFNKFIKEIKNLSLPGIKKKQVDDKKAEIDNDFN